MSKYAEFKVIVRNLDAPDWGQGKGVIVTQKVVINDDESVGARQILTHREKMLNEYVDVDIVEISKEEYDKEDVEIEKTELDLLNEFLIETGRKPNEKSNQNFPPVPIIDSHQNPVGSSAAGMPKLAVRVMFPVDTSPMV